MDLAYSFLTEAHTTVGSECLRLFVWQVKVSEEAVATGLVTNMCVSLYEHTCLQHSREFSRQEIRHPTVHTDIA